MNCGEKYFFVKSETKFAYIFSKLGHKGTSPLDRLSSLKIKAELKYCSFFSHFKWAVLENYKVIII